MRQQVDWLDQSEALGRQVAQAEAEIAEGKRTVQMAKDEAVIEKEVKSNRAKLEKQIFTWKKDPKYKSEVMRTSFKNQCYLCDKKCYNSSCDACMPAPK